MIVTPEEIERRAQITSDTSGGIIPYVEVFHISSILYSAERCLEAFEQFEERIQSEAPAPELVSSVQEAVIHAAAVSRYFWPSPMGKKKEPEYKRMKALRGEKLRTAFCLDETSALYDRELRNAWEHFDERLDRYFLAASAGQFFPDPVIGSHTLADNPVQHYLKLLDTDAHCLVLLGAKHYYEEIRDSIQTVAEKARELYEAGGRLPR